MPKDAAPDDAKQSRNRVVPTFGNPTLVTGRLNPSMSNRGWEVKKKALSEHGAFALNRRSALWGVGEAAIERRGNELFEVERTICPRPIVTASSAVTTAPAH